TRCGYGWQPCPLPDTVEVQSCFFILAQRYAGFHIVQHNFRIPDKPVRNILPDILVVILWIDEFSGIITGIAPIPVFNRTLARVQPMLDLNGIRSRIPYFPFAYLYNTIRLFSAEVFRSWSPFRSFIKNSGIKSGFPIFVRSCRMVLIIPIKPRTICHGVIVHQVTYRRIGPPIVPTIRSAYESYLHIILQSEIPKENILFVVFGYK